MLHGKLNFMLIKKKYPTPYARSPDTASPYSFLDILVYRHCDVHQSLTMWLFGKLRVYQTLEKFSKDFLLLNWSRWWLKKKRVNCDYFPRFPKTEFAITVVKQLHRTARIVHKCSCFPLVYVQVHMGPSICRNTSSTVGDFVYHLGLPFFRKVVSGCPC